MSVTFELFNCHHRSELHYVVGVVCHLVLVVEEGSC